MPAENQLSRRDMVVMALFALVVLGVVVAVVVASMSGGTEPGGEASPTVSSPTSIVEQEQQAVALDLELDRKLARLAEKIAQNPDLLPAAKFRIASFNVLGSSHTSANGNKPHYASGTDRVRMALQALARVEVSVVGFQELEPDQARVVSSRFQLWPGNAARGVRNSIGWDPRVWTLVERRMQAFPYFHGKRVPMPYVLLEHKETGRQAWFINVHNPVSSKRRGNNDHWRAVAVREQVALVRRLHTATTPVFLTGDFNARSAAFCAIAGSGMKAANGGSGSPCSPPASAGIDWIFATPDVDFGGYWRDDSGFIDRTSDHPLIYATVGLTTAIEKPREQ